MNIDEFSDRMNEILDQIEGPRTERVVTEILISVQSHTMPMVPVMTGNLANSIFRQVNTGAKGYDGYFGFTAKYAADVHQKPGTLKGKGVLRDINRPGFGYVWDPEGEPKFLEKGAREMIDEDLDGILKRGYGL